MGINQSQWESIRDNGNNLETMGINRKHEKSIGENGNI